MLYFIPDMKDNSEKLLLLSMPISQTKLSYTKEVCAQKSRCQSYVL